MVLRRLTDLIDPSSSLSVLPQWKYMYSFTAYPKGLFENLLRQPLTVSLPAWFVFTSFPFVERQNILLHTLLIHELGHFKDVVDGLTDSVTRQIKIDQDAVKVLAEKIGSTKLKSATTAERVDANNDQGAQMTLADFLGDQIRQAVHARCSKILTNWLKEIAADLIAIRILGPAFFFALAEASALFGVMDRYSDTHPSSNFRLKYLLLELARLGFMSGIQRTSIGDRLRAWQSDLQARDLVPQEDHQRIAYSTITGSFDIIENAVAAAPRLYTYSVEAFNRDVAPIVDLFLKQGIPPIDKWDKTTGMNSPWNLVSVVNAGWTGYLESVVERYEVPGRDESVRSYEALRNYSEILLKAIESNEILQRWRS